MTLWDEDKPYPIDFKAAIGRARATAKGTFAMMELIGMHVAESLGFLLTKDPAIPIRCVIAPIPWPAPDY